MTVGDFCEGLDETFCNKFLIAFVSAVWSVGYGDSRKFAISPLLKLNQQEAKFSWFKANEKPLNSRKQWISGALQVKGKITIDQGASEAIKKGFSILSAGIIKTEGNYEKGDLIQIIDENETFVGKGLTHFNNSEVELIKGSKSNNIETILGYRGKDEVVHRDDLVFEKK